MGVVSYEGDLGATGDTIRLSDGRAPHFLRAQ